MKKRIFLTLLALLVAALAAFPAGAEELTGEAGGSCGDTMTWSYQDGTLMITGEGEMYNYGQGAPWDEYRDEIKCVSISDGVTYVGACAFRDYDALETVEFGEGLTQIGQYAFQSCDKLTSISLPESFKIFDEGCFSSCKSLTQIHCAGKFPTFRQNSMWDTRATIYYPAERPWSLSLIIQLEEAFSGRIEFIASDGVDPYVPATATEAEQEETVPETTEATEPETEPVTEPTQAPTEPEVTEAPTVPETIPAEEETQAPTDAVREEEPEDTENNVTGLLIGLLVVIIVMTLVIICALVFKSRGKGKFSR